MEMVEWEYTKAMRRDALILTCAAIIAVGIGIFMFFSGRGDLSNNSSAAAAVTVPFTKLAEGSQSEVQRRVNYIITSSSQFSELWKMANEAGTPPEIDFKTHSVVAVFAGEKPVAGYSITVEKIEDADARLVSIALAEPSDDCILAQVVTAPYEIIKVPNTSLPLAHKDIVTISGCPK